MINLTEFEKVNINILKELAKTVTDTTELVEINNLIAKPIKYKDIALRNRENLEYMRLVHAHYEELKIKDSDFLKVDNQLYILEQKLSKLDEKLAALESDDEPSDGIISEYKARMIDKNIYFIADSESYIEIDGSNHFYYRRHGFRDLYANPGDESTAIHIAMRMLGKVKKTVVNTFKSCPSNYLNLMSREHWLKPVDGPVDKMFDLLMDSLSCGDAESREHIEQVLVYKYLHPEEHRLPCISWHGEGGAGKNTLMETLKVIFGDNQVAIVKHDDIFGQYNGTVLAKTIILVDEVAIDNQSAERMRQTVGNNTIAVNVKYGPQKQVDNTALYFIAGNETNGSVKLRGDETDRRWSIIGIKPKINLWHWVKHYFNLPANASDKLISETWYAHDKILREPLEVAKWLNSLIVKYGAMEQPPAALHNTFYKQLIISQRGWFDSLMEELFNDNFQYIKRDTLYTIAKEYAKINSPSSSRVKQKQSFFSEVDNWLIKNSITHITAQDMKIAKQEHGYKYRTGDEARNNASNYTRNQCYVNSNAQLEKVVADNSRKFFDYDVNTREYTFHFDIPFIDEDDDIEPIVVSPVSKLIDELSTSTFISPEKQESIISPIKPDSTPVIQNVQAEQHPLLKSFLVHLNTAIASGDIENANKWQTKVDKIRAKVGGEL